VLTRRESKGVRFTQVRRLEQHFNEVLHINPSHRPTLTIVKHYFKLGQENSLYSENHEQVLNTYITAGCLYMKEP
jgi:hypothetical protein